MANSLSLIPPPVPITGVAGDSISISIDVQNSDGTPYPTLGKTLIGQLNKQPDPLSKPPYALTLTSTVDGTVVWTMTAAETTTYTGINRYRIAVSDSTTTRTVLVGTLTLTDVV